MLEYNNDKPVSSREEDAFQRFEFAKRIAGIVSSSRSDKSMVIGINGKWGEGKSSVLNFIRKELAEDTVVVNFNPWLFSDEIHLIKSFFDLLTISLNNH